MNTETQTAKDVPSDAPDKQAELKSEAPEHDSGSGRFKPKGGADTRKKGKDAPAPKKKASLPKGKPPPSVKQAPSESPPVKPEDVPPVPALASVPAAPPPGTTPPGAPPPPVTHGFRGVYLATLPSPAPTPPPSSTTFTAPRVGFRR